MGRELRMVVPNWEHPKRDDGRYEPKLNESYKEAITEWIKNHQLWEEGKHPDQLDGSGKKYRYYAEWYGNPPDPEYYIPDWKLEERTWYQVYETVSEGTPVTPPFATKQELIEYLVENGDFWDQKRRKEDRGYGMPCAPWSRKAAEQFVNETGWAMSGMICNGVFGRGTDAPDMVKNEK